MLTEHFVASIAAPTKPNTGVTKDAGIFLHEYQPLAAQRHVFKKSASAPNGLAVSASHIFAAQEGKAVVHVYSREKGNQEAIVPFPERIHSIALACGDAVLLLGAESGRIMAWEVCTGRVVSTATSHLQPVTVLAVEPSSNFFLSGSPDAMIHVWNLPSILSFSLDASRSPIQTLSTHRGPITHIASGHSSTAANIAVSISEDMSALVWDYHNGQALRTYLLPDTPTAVTLDPADRAFFVAYADGSLQTLSFYDEMQQSTPVDVLREGSQSHRPLQPPPSTRFNAESQKLGAARSLSLTWDGTTLISGHESGKIAAWDVAKGTYLSTLASLPGPVTNLLFLPPTGFPLNAAEPTFKVHTVTKPRQDLVMPADGNALVPPNYGFNNVQFTGRLELPSCSATEMGRPEGRKSKFEEALTHTSFPLEMLEESLAELETWGQQQSGGASNVVPAVADFLSFAGAAEDTGAVQGDQGGKDELQELKEQFAALQRIQKVTFTQLSELREEKEYLLARERKRVQKKRMQQEKKEGGKEEGAMNGDGDGDVEMSEDEEEEEEEESLGSSGSDDGVGGSEEEDGTSSD
ncbi:WD domain-containing protein [Westerdykella ornata]|uniref:Pre-rRNA-processing protein IPI3 n=1 Tax=Westerdykella ornata TaxID=318751 RepID=A0A6A6JBH7_WESOR|nr:WD domain-containing protein [Westerdykella ornata]KAF2273645.1 WD domain-containing protein [Westerdykella ornata]